MSWRAQNRSKDAKTPSAALAMSENPNPALCGIQRYLATLDVISSVLGLQRLRLIPSIPHLGGKRPGAGRSGPRFGACRFLLPAGYEDLPSAPPNLLWRAKAKVGSGSSCSWRSSIAPNAGSPCAELWSLMCWRRLRTF
jgi:hypothetical protein